MSSFQPVSYGEFKRDLLKLVGLTVSKEVFSSQIGNELMWNLNYYMNLNFRALSSPDLSNEPSSDERRLKEIARVLIEYVNMITAHYHTRLGQHQKTMSDTVSLGKICTEMAAMLSKQESQLEDKVAENAILVTKISELKDQIRLLNSIVKTQKNAIDEIHSESATALAQLLDANNKIKDQDFQIDQLEDQINSGDQIKFDMEHQLDNLHNEIQLLQNTMTNMKRKHQDKNEDGSPSDVAEFEAFYSNKSPRLDDALGLGYSSPESTLGESEESEGPEESEEEKESEDDTPCFDQELPPTSTEADQPNVDKSKAESALPIPGTQELPMNLN
mgnify:CR=1 FL=1